MLYLCRVLGFITCRSNFSLLLSSPAGRKESKLLPKICKPLALMCAGRVLYNWRVFPIPLSEAPTRLFNSTVSTSAPSSRHLLGVLHDASITSQEQHVVQSGGEGVEIVGGDMQLGAVNRVEAAQSGSQAAQLGSTRDCKAWPQAGGPVDGPVIFRCSFQPSCEGLAYHCRTNPLLLDHVGSLYIGRQHAV